MTHVVEYEAPGDAELYEKVKAAIGDPPDALQVQLVVASKTGGLRHIEVWDSVDDQERFARERVAPALAEVLRSMGVSTTPPLVPRLPLDVVDVHVQG